MSATIDERVVSMQFDNKQFESNVQTSLGTIDKLKQSLNFTGASKGLENINAAAKGCDMSILGSAVESVKYRFSALEVMAVTALANITNQAVNAGKRLVSAFTIDPIKSGFQEYETQINAVQTILANTESKGTTLQDVNSALDTLNTYADKTIYNFTEMTRNIGTFTAAGVDLDTSVNAIQGIANLAAVSGSTSQQASTAMYQLSQALASGTVKLQDWNSVVNAGMGGQVFQDALKETAKVHGIAIDDMIKKNGSFRETLQEGWLTSEILTETLQKFTMTTEGLTDAQIQQNREMLKSKGYSDEQIDAIFKLGETATDAATKVKTFSQLMDTLKEAAQSGWTQTWELLVGDFEEAKELWTNVSNVFGDMINNSAEARNTLLEKALTSNWDQMIKKVNEAGVETSKFEEVLRHRLSANGYDVDALVKKYGSLEEACRAGAVSTDVLREALKALKIKGLADDCEGLVRNIDKVSGRELLIQGITNAFNGLMSVIKPIKEAFGEVFKPLQSHQIYNAIKSFEEFTAKLTLSEEHSKQLKTTFKGLFSVLKMVADFFIAVGKGALSLLGNFSGLGGTILSATSSLGEWLIGLKKSQEASDIFGRTVSAIVGFLTKIIEKFKELTNIGGIGSFFKDIWHTLKYVGSKIVESLGVVWDGLLEAFNNGDLNSFMDILNKGLLSMLILKIQGFIGSLKKEAESSKGLVENLKGIIDNITGVLDSVRDALKTWQSSLKADMLMKIAGAVGILALSILILSSIDPEKMNASLGAITILFAELAGSIAILSKISTTLGGATSTIGLMLGMSASIFILAGALKMISSLDEKQIESGVLGLAACMGVIILAVEALSSKDNTAIKGATQIVVLAFAIKILASVIKDLSSLSLEEIGKGLLSVGGLLTEIDIFLNTAKFSDGSIATAASMVILAGAIAILGKCCKSFAEMSWEDIGKGLTSIGGLLTEICAFQNLAGGAKKVISTAFSMTIIAGSLLMLTSVMTKLSALSWDGISRSLTGIGGALLMLVLAAEAFPKDDLISLSASLPAATSALIPLAEGLERMAKLSWDDVGRSLAAMAGSIAILAVGLNCMKGTLSGSAALLVASVALLAIAVSIRAIAGIGIIGTIGTLVTLAGTFFILAVAAQVLTPMVPSILALSGAIAVLGMSFVALGAGIAVIGTGFVTFITGLAGGILILSSMSWGNLIKGLVALAATFAIIGAAAFLLKPLIPAIFSVSGAIAILGLSCLSVALAISVMTGALSLLSTIGKEGAEAMVSSLKVMIVGLLDLIPSLLTSLFAIAKSLIIGLIDVISECTPQIVEGLFKTLLGVLDGLVQYGPAIIDRLFTFVIQLIDGLAARIPELVSSVINLVSELITSVMNALSSIVDTNALVDALLAVGMLSGLVVVLSAISGFIPGAMVAVVGLGGIVAELALVLAAIGALAQIPGLDWLVGEGGALLESIGNAIGGFVGGIIGGALEGISDSFPAIATNLSTFMTNLQPFIDGASSLDASSLEGVSTLIGIITAITGATLLESITSWITGGSSITTFGAQLVPFGQAISDFAGVVSGIDTAAITAAATAAQGLTALANAIPAEGGILQLFGGERDLSVFGTQLPAFGEGIKSFADKVAGIDPAAIEAAASAGASLATLANSIPAEGGILQLFSGERDLSSFGTQLGSFGDGIKGFADKVVGIDTAAITAVAGVVPSLVEMANQIPAEGGLFQVFSGERDLANFGTQLSSFGDGIKGFADKVAGMDTAAVTTATDASNKLVEMANNIPEEGGLFQIFSGSKDLSSFGTQLSNFGDGIKGFADKVAGIDTSAVDSATESAVALGSMAASLPDGTSIDKVKWLGEKLKGLGTGIKDFSTQVSGIDIEGSKSAVTVIRTISGMTNFLPDSTAINNLKSFGDKLKGLGTGLKNYASEVSGVDTSGLSGATKEISRLAGSLSRMSGMDFSAADSFSKTLKSISKTSIDDFIQAFTDANSRVLEAGKSFMQNATKGIKNERGSITKAIKEIVTSCKKALRDGHQDFYNAGKYVATGFADGIENSAYKAKTAAKAMANAAKKAAEEALDENSPSKVFYGIGDYAGIGFVNALVDNTSDSYKAGRSIAESARKGLSTAISQIQNLIDSGIDSQPTIRPVLDLSNVAAGANSINGMFDMNPSVGAMSNVRTISAMMNGIQNGSNSDVIEAIEDLGRKIGKVSGDTYSINGITYDDGSNVSEAVKTIVRAARVERRR